MPIHAFTVALNSVRFFPIFSCLCYGCGIMDNPKTSPQKLESIRAWRQKNPEKVREYQHRYSSTHKEAALKWRHEKRNPESKEKGYARSAEHRKRRREMDPEYRKKLSLRSMQWAAANRDRFLAIQWRTHLRRKYNISVEEYEALLVRQGNACAICGTVTKLKLDHDHKTGAIRGALCHGCNAGIGFFAENPRALRAAAQYVEQGSLTTL